MITSTMRRMVLACAALTLTLTACSGRDIQLGDGSGASSGGESTIGAYPTDAGYFTDSGAVCASGCGPGEQCCQVAVDEQTCATTTACIAAAFCPPLTCSPGTWIDAGIGVVQDGGSTVGEQDSGTSVEVDAAPVETDASAVDDDAGLVMCGADSCLSGQECCIVVTNVQACTVGLQCVYGGCPPAPCDPQGN